MKCGHLGTDLGQHLYTTSIGCFPKPSFHINSHIMVYIFHIIHTNTHTPNLTKNIYTRKNIILYRIIKEREKYISRLMLAEKANEKYEKNKSSLKLIEFHVLCSLSPWSHTCANIKCERVISIN